VGNEIRVGLLPGDASDEDIDALVADLLDDGADEKPTSPKD
jgi:hypothetical protein